MRFSSTNKILFTETEKLFSSKLNVYIFYNCGNIKISKSYLIQFSGSFHFKNDDHEQHTIKLGKDAFFYLKYILITYNSIKSRTFGFGFNYKF